MNNKDPYPLDEVKAENNDSNRNKEIAEALLKEIPATKKIHFKELAKILIEEKGVIKSWKQLAFFLHRLKEEGKIYEPEPDYFQKVQDWAVDEKEVRLHVGSNTFVVKIKVYKE